MHAAHLVPSCNAGKGREERFTLASAVDLRLFGPRVRDDNRKSPHWACHRHLSRVALSLLLVCQNQHYILSVWSGFFFLPQGNQRSLLDSSPGLRVYTLRGFISHHVGEPTQCWWATDTDVLGEAMACITHFAHGRTTPRCSTDWQAAHDELFHRCRGLLLDCSGKAGASSSFIIGSSGL